MSASFLNSTTTHVVLAEVGFTILFATLGLHASFVDLGLGLGSELGIEPLFDMSGGHAGHGHGVAETFNAGACDAPAYEYSYSGDGHHGHDHGYTYNSTGYERIDNTITTHDHAHDFSNTSSTFNEAGAGAGEPAAAAHAHHPNMCYNADEGVINITNEHGTRLYDVERKLFLNEQGVPFMPALQKGLAGHMTTHPEFVNILGHLSATQTVPPTLACP